MLILYHKNRFKKLHKNIVNIQKDAYLCLRTDKSSFVVYLLSSFYIQAVVLGKAAAFFLFRLPPSLFSALFGVLFFE